MAGFSKTDLHRRLRERIHKLIVSRRTSYASPPFVGTPLCGWTPPSPFQSPGGLSIRRWKARVGRADVWAVVRLSIAFALILVRAEVSQAQEFRIGDWRAYALVGPPNLQEQIQYVCFSGDQ